MAWAKGQLQRRLRVSVPAGTVQRCASVLGARVDVCPVGRQREHGQAVAIHGRVVDCQPPVHIWKPTTGRECMGGGRRERENTLEQQAICSAVSPMTS